MEKRKTESPWTVDRIKLRPMDEAPKRRPRQETAEPVDAIMERIRQHLPQHLAPLNGPETSKAISRPRQVQPTIPGYMSKRVNDLRILSSDNLALLSRALTERLTPSGVQLSVGGPRKWNSETRRLEWLEWSESDMRQLTWAAGVCRKALAERDDQRMTRSIACCMALPSSGDNIGDDAAEMYLAVLEPFPVWAVERACVQWATENRWRPAPADLVTLCREAVALCERIVENERLALEYDRRGKEKCS